MDHDIGLTLRCSTTDGIVKWRTHMTYDHPCFRVVHHGEAIWSDAIHFEHTYDFTEEGFKTPALVTAVEEHVRSIGLDTAFEQHGIPVSTAVDSVVALIVNPIHATATAWIRNTISAVEQQPDIQPDQLAPVQRVCRAVYHADHARVVTRKDGIDTCVWEGPLDFDEDVLTDASGVDQANVVDVVKRYVDSLPGASEFSRDVRVEIMVFLVEEIKDMFAQPNDDEA